LDLDSLQRPRRRGQPEEKLENGPLKRGDARTRGRDFCEEMQIVREAISSLRSMFRYISPASSPYSVKYVSPALVHVQADISIFVSCLIWYLQPPVHVQVDISSLWFMFR
jgi:hypothetical protein